MVEQRIRPDGEIIFTIRGSAMVLVGPWSNGMTSHSHCGSGSSILPGSTKTIGHCANGGSIPPRSTKIKLSGILSIDCILTEK